MKYGLVKNGLVHSTFESELPKSAFPDIAPLLVEITPEVESNWTVTDGVFSPPQAPAPEPTEQERLIAAMEKAGVVTKAQREAIEADVKAISVKAVDPVIEATIEAAP